VLSSAAASFLPTTHTLLFYSASYGGLDNWQEAADDAKECIRLDPSFVKGYYRLATAQIELKDYDGATATIRQGLTVDAGNLQLTKLQRMVQQNKQVQKAKQESAAAGPRQLDAAQTRELQELQMQFQQTNRDLQIAQANLAKAQREARIAELTKSELEQLPDETACYRSIGKMFLRSSVPGVMEHLNTQLDVGKKTEAEMKQKMDYLERQAKSLRLNVEELVGSAAS
jgi:stress-induced-phosphoprotein 1